MKKNESHKDSTLSTIGNLIKYLRIKNNMTQEYISKKCNMSPSQFGKYERGEINFTILTIQKIANALDLTLEEFLFEFTLSVKAIPPDDPVKIIKRSGFDASENKENKTITLVYKSSPDFSVTMDRYIFNNMIEKINNESDKIKTDILKNKICEKFLRLIRSH